MTKSDHALASFRKGFTCSSAVFSAFSDEMGLDSETATKIACGFGGGISKTGNICGAVSGAIMVIGLKYGKTIQGDDAATEKTRALVREFMQEFTKRVPDAAIKRSFLVKHSHPRRHTRSDLNELGD